jgi:hypothetical protein
MRTVVQCAPLASLLLRRRSTMRRLMTAERMH